MFNKLRIASLAMVGVAVVVLMADGADKQHPQFKITTKRDQDRVSVASEADATVFVVQSPFGISDAVIERAQEKWPERVDLRLYLKGLEKFSVSNGKLRLNAAFSSSDAKTKPRLWKDDREDLLLDPHDPDGLSVVRVNNDSRDDSKEDKNNRGYFSIRLPKSFFDENPKTFSVSWIDFYRT